MFKTVDALQVKVQASNECGIGEISDEFNIPSAGIPSQIKEFSSTYGMHKC